MEESSQMITICKKKKEKLVGSLTSRRQPWSIVDDKLLTKGFLHVSNDCVMGNVKKGSDFWKRVLDYYMEGEGSSAVRTADNLRSHWHMLKKNVTSFNNIMIELRTGQKGDLSYDQLKSEAYMVYKESNKTSFIHEHVWNLVKDEPEWKKQTQTSSDIQVPKRIKTSASHDLVTVSNSNTYIKLNDDVDDIPLSVEDYEGAEESPCSMDIKKPKGTKRKDIEDETTEFDNMFQKKMDVMEQFNANMAKMLELKEKKLEMKILYKDTSQMDPETLAFHKEHCAMIREKYGKKK